MLWGGVNDIGTSYQTVKRMDSSVNSSFSVDTLRIGSSNSSNRNPKGLLGGGYQINNTTGLYTGTSKDFGIVLGYDSERTPLTPSMHTINRVLRSGQESAYALFETINDKKVRTGCKYMLTITNNSSSDILVNQVGLAYNSYGGDSVNGQTSSYLTLVAVKYLDEDVTIAPQETYTFEYELKDLCPINEDLY